MSKYRKKPVVIEAVVASKLITGFTSDWASLPPWAKEAYENGTIVAIRHDGFTIKTLEGDHRAESSDMVIQGIKGELCACKPDIFDATYEAVD